MSKDSIIYIVHSETIDLNIEFVENDELVDSNELKTSWEILKYPNKDKVVSSDGTTIGKEVTIPTEATDNLLGEYILRLKVQYKAKVLIEDRKLEVSK